MATINPVLTGVPADQLEISDWAIIVDDARYAITKNGAIGQIVGRIDETSFLMKFEPDTCVMPPNIHPAIRRSDMMFAVSVRDVAGIEPPAERIAEETERELCRRREELRTRALQRLKESFTDLRVNTYHRRNKALGQRIANAIQRFKDGHGAAELKGALNDLPTDSRTARDILERAGATDELCFCDRCGALDWYTDVEKVHSDAIETWCSSCTCDDSVWSDEMRAYIDESQIRNVYYSLSSFRAGSPDDYCTYRYGLDSNTLEYYDGAFVDSDTYYDLTRGEDSDDDGLTDYHSSYRAWKISNSTPAVPAIGMELELYAENEDRSDAVYAFKDAFADWYYERDGSLCEEYGFEVITQPYGPVEWRRIALDISKIASNVGARGYAHSDSSMYGIHLNVDRRKLSPLQELRMLMFMQWDGNREFLIAIAQRDALYSTSYGFGEMTLPTARALGGLYTESVSQSGRYRRKPVSLGKYSALYLHDNNDIAEFRLFQSSTRYETIMKNLEFVWALIAWTSTTAATGMSYNHRDFVAWLGTTQSESTYPHLFAYLRQPYYTGQHFDARIKNTWATLLPTTTTKSLDVVVADLDAKLAA